MIGYGILLAVAILANRKDPRMFLLSIVVGGGIFAPIPDAYFYLICACVETVVAGLAVALNAGASRPVARISMLLIIFHGLGWVYDGYPPESPYHIMVKVCEYSELVICILLSRPFTKRLENGL